MQKHFRLSLYYIDLKYIRELHKIDEHVQSVSPQKGKAKKKQEKKKASRSRHWQKMSM